MIKVSLNKEEMTKRRRVLQTLLDMKNRCYNKEDKAYNRYGGRGIIICERWLDSKENFYEDMKDTWTSEKNTIDRINNDGNYELSNCQWISKSENSKKSVSERIRNKTFHLSSGEIQKKSAIERVNNKTHPWVGGNFQKNQIINGTHSSLIKVTCIFCGITCMKSNHTRWHGNNCRNKGNL